MKISRIPVKFLVIVVGAAFWAAPVSAQFTWTGADNTLWSNPQNWNPNGVPGITDPFEPDLALAIFDNAGNGNTVIDLGSSPTNHVVEFNPGAAAYTLGTAGQTYVIPLNYANPQITVNAGVTNNQTIAANIELYMSQVVAQEIYFTNESAASLTFSGASITAPHSYPSQFASAIYLTGNGTGVGTISSQINILGANLGIIKQGTGTWQLLNPANAFMNTEDGFMLEEGTLVVTSLANYNQPSSIGIIEGADEKAFVMATQGDATLRHLGTASSTNWDWTMGAGASSDPNTATFEIVESSTLAMNGTGGGVAILQKTGAGTLALNGNNTYNQATIISEGILSVMQIANGGHASGIGSSSSNAGNLVFDGGTLQYSNSLTATTDRGFSITSGETAHFDIVGETGITFSGSVPFTTGGILLTGGGSLLLSGNNQYSGPTTVSGMNTTLVAGSNSGPFGGPLGINSDVILSLGATLATGSNVSNLIIGSLTGDASTQLSLFAGSSQDNLTINNSRDATFNGIISWSSGGIVKQGSGTQTLTGANYYQGQTIVMGGSLVISGANGTIAPTSSIGISGDSALVVENPGNATVSNRLGNGVPVTMGGGTLAFRTDAATPDVTNTLGALALNAGTNIIENGQAASGKNSTLTFASLTRQGSASVNFTGEGLGLSDRNRVFFTEAPALGDWAIYNGVGYATYNATLGVVETLYADVTRGSSGQKTIYNAPDEILRIIDGTGTASPIELGGGGDHPPSPPPPEPPTTLTNIHSIAQTATGGPVTINVESYQIFQTMSILGGNGSGALTIGTAPNVGTISSSDTAIGSQNRRFSLINHSSEAMVINSKIGNAWIYGGPMVIALVKSGPGTVVLAGNNTYDGTTTIADGMLSISLWGNEGQASNLGLAPGVAQNIVFEGGTLLYTGGNASTNRGFTVNGTGSRIEMVAPFYFTGNHGIVLASGDLTIGGAGNTTISTVISGNGSLAKDGSSTLTLGANNTLTGNVTVREGTLSVANILNLGNASTDPSTLVLDGGTLQVTDGSWATNRGMTITSNGGILNLTNPDGNLVFAQQDIHITHGGVFTVDTPGRVTLAAIPDITGGGALRKAGGGLLALGGPIYLFTGGVTLSGGVLGTGANLNDGGSPGALGASTADPANILFDGGTLELAAWYSATTTNRGFSISANKTAVIQTDSGVNLTMSGDVPVTTGAFAKTGAGTLALSGNLSYTGTTTVEAGTLRINGRLGPGASYLNPVYVEPGATLGGSGTIQRPVYVFGTHSPGNSPGVQTVEGNLIYEGGSNVVWELISSTTEGRGVNYDGIDGDGHTVDLTVATLQLVFNLPGSTVKWSDGLWGANRQWVVYSGFVPVGFAGFTLAPTDWADSTGVLLSEALPDSTFTLTQSGQDIILNYTGVPEPSTWALLALAALVLLCRRNFFRAPRAAATELMRRQS